jgi:hypothetical protein
MDDDTLTLIVSEGTLVTGDNEVRGERSDAEVRGIISQLKPRRKDVNLEDVKSDLDRVQAQIDTLLAGVGSHDNERFRLSSVEISLAISAEGSIGVATAGVQAGISLTFARRDEAG